MEPSLYALPKLEVLDNVPHPLYTTPEMRVDMFMRLIEGEDNPLYKTAMEFKVEDILFSEWIPSC